MTVPTIVKVIPKEGLRLDVTFSDGQTKELDITPYLDTFEPFKALQNPALFNAVKVDTGGMGIVWNDRIDLSRYDAWELGVSM